jgi:hypothetical protein
MFADSQAPVAVSDAAAAGDLAAGAEGAVIAGTADDFSGIDPFVLAEPGVSVYSSRAVTSLPSVLLAATERAVRGEVQVLADAALVAEASLDLATQAVPRTFFYFARIDALASFDDAMAAFIDDSAAEPTEMASVRTKAWIITAAVLAADIALLTYWHRKRACKAKSPQRGRLNPAYAIQW